MDTFAAMAAFSPPKPSLKGDIGTSEHAKVQNATIMTAPNSSNDVVEQSRPGNLSPSSGDHLEAVDDLSEDLMSPDDLFRSGMRPWVSPKRLAEVKVDFPLDGRCLLAYLVA